ncbi:hypothetical protein BKA57DRAFT_405623, partial [Linnemannia elongata]
FFLPSLHFSPSLFPFSLSLSLSHTHTFTFTSSLHLTFLHFHPSIFLLSTTPLTHHSIPISLIGEQQHQHTKSRLCYLIFHFRSGFNHLWLNLLLSFLLLNGTQQIDKQTQVFTLS